jgi:hypothetical protein
MPERRGRPVLGNSRLYPVCVRGEFHPVSIRMETRGLWVARASYQGQTIEANGADRLAALSRWQAAARGESLRNQVRRPGGGPCE